MVLRSSSSSFSTLSPQQQQGRSCFCDARRNMFVVIGALLLTFLVLSRQFDVSLQHGNSSPEVNSPTGIPLRTQPEQHHGHNDKREFGTVVLQKANTQPSEQSDEKVAIKNERKDGEMTKCEDMSVGLLMRANDLRVVGTSTEPAILIAVFDTNRDNMISKFILQYGAWDPAVLSALLFLIGQTDGCLDPVTHERLLMIDVGANVGYFGLQAAVMGCETHFYEPQLATQAAIVSGICLNGVGSHAMLHKGAVTPLSKITFPVGGLKRGTEGGNIGHVRAENCQDNGDDRSDAVGCQTVKGYQLDKMHTSLFLNNSATAAAGGGGGGGNGGGASRNLPPIILMKIDVEGSEPYVIETAWKLIRANLVSNIVFEFTPTKATSDLYVQTLRELRDAGYFLAELPYTHMTGTDATLAGHDIATAVPLTDIQLFAERILSTGDWRGVMFTDVWATIEKDAYERFNEKKMRVEPIFA